MDQQVQDHSQTPNQRVYEPPQVRDLGSLADITQGPTGGSIDAIFGGTGGFQS